MVRQTFIVRQVAQNENPGSHYLPGFSLVWVHELHIITFITFSVTYIIYYIYGFVNTFYKYLSSKKNGSKPFFYVCFAILLQISTNYVSCDIMPMGKGIYLFPFWHHRKGGASHEGFNYSIIFNIINYHLDKEVNHLRQ